MGGEGRRERAGSTEPGAGCPPGRTACLPQLYGRLYRVVEPKRIRMNAALAQLQEKQAALAEAQEKLREVSPESGPHSALSTLHLFL